jgi:hypothetical protein
LFVNRVHEVVAPLWLLKLPVVEIDIVVVISDALLVKPPFIVSEAIETLPLFVKIPVGVKLLIVKVPLFVKDAFRPSVKVLLEFVIVPLLIIAPVLYVIVPLFVKVFPELIVNVAPLNVKLQPLSMVILLKLFVPEKLGYLPLLFVGITMSSPLTGTPLGFQFAGVVQVVELLVFLHVFIAEKLFKDITVKIVK